MVPDQVIESLPDQVIEPLVLLTLDDVVSLMANVQMREIMGCKEGI